MDNKYLITKNGLTNKNEFPFTYCGNEKEGKEILKKNQANLNYWSNSMK